MKNLGILLSGRGSNFEAITRHIQAGEIPARIAVVISNRAEARGLARAREMGFNTRLIPSQGQEREAYDREVVAVLNEFQVDLVCLAGFMRVLSPYFVREFPRRILNIHHSFLPAFVGAKPYHQAFERGVKIIGVTSHYVTAGLDEGPIVEQDVARISHRDKVKDLIQKGRDLERVVLSRAVRWHLENRILLYGNKTVVFN